VILLGKSKGFLGYRSSFRLTIEELAFHTVVLASSGAGKSCLIGRLVEELALGRRARSILIDTNSDFLRFDQVSERVWSERRFSKWLAHRDTRQSFAPRWARVSIDVRSTSGGDLGIKPLKLRWPNLSHRQMAQHLGLREHSEPLTQAFLTLNRWLAENSYGPYYSIDEFSEVAAEMLNWGQLQSTELEALQADPLLTDPSEPVLLALLRYVAAVKHLQELAIWSKRDGTAAVEDLVADDSIQVIALDVQSLGEREEREIVVQEAVEIVWTHCQKRTTEGLLGTNGDGHLPYFLVIDEAHNWAAAEPRSLREGRICELLRSVAAEGRKSGLFLVLCTQRPRKLHPDVLSECDNVFLMRLPNPADLAHVAGQYGQIPSRLRRARRFSAGETIFISGQTGRAQGFHASPRRTTEGGAGVVERE